ncbi:hemerythrin domain-containing protein [Streptomyces sp. NPDC001698]|uniref:hemerythrin domain-containing protein n=1 Tax=unclassified Streptomyces TaxID=2593676 RepID=UPI00368CEAB6
MSSERLQTLPDHFHGFARMHIAMRRDARRLAGGARSVTAEQMVPVSTWWHRLREVIDWHHHSEDEVPWPELHRAIPGFAEAARTLGDDHGQLDDAMDRVDEAFVHGAPAGLIPAAVRRRYERTLAPVVRLAQAAQVSDDKETQR